MLKCSFKSNPEGVSIYITAIFQYGSQLYKRAEELQTLVAREVEKMTAFNILSVNIEIRGLRPDGENADAAAEK